MPPSPQQSIAADVVIVGAGLAGATAAHVLASQGVRVVLVDRRATCPPCFKAEKIEPDQADLFRRFGLMGQLLPFTGAIREIRRASGNRVLRTVEIEQYGIYYYEMVNAIRATLPPSVRVVVGAVADLVTGQTPEDRPVVTLASGERIDARLVVLASGTGGDLHSRLGLERRMVASEHSVSFGFTVERRDGRAFDYDSVTYYPASVSSRIAFLTLFRLGTTMRANFFTYWSNRGDETRRFIREPDAGMAAWMPGLIKVAGDLAITGRVESARVDLFTVEPPSRHGLVLLADAGQSVCPTTGSGLSKVLTDVDVLCHACVPRWLESPGMGAEKLAVYYSDPRKRAVDRSSLAGALYTKRLWTDATLPWRLRRLRWFVDNQVAEWPVSRFTRKLTA